MSDPAAMLGEWEAHLRDARRRSPHTVRAYVGAARRLLHTDANWNAIARMDPRALRSHLAHRRADGLSNTSAARELSALKAFVIFAKERAGLADTAPPRMRGPRVKKGIPRPVTPEDAASLAETVDALAREDWIGARDKAVLLLLYGAGLRIAEALSLDARVLPLGEVLRVKGKGGKERVVPILPAISEAMQNYARLCPWPLTPNERLFRGAKGGPLSPTMVQRVLAQARRALGLPDSATPHALRHSFATHLLGAGADLRSLQELLGHASLGSTQIYTKVDAATMLDTYRAAHPRERD